MGGKLDAAYDKGRSDFDNDRGYHPPSSDGLKSVFDSMTSFTTSDERDSAYNAGRSDAGRDAKK